MATENSTNQAFITIDNTILKDDNFNANAMTMLVDNVQPWREVVKTIETGGKEKTKARHQGRGKMLVRDRIKTLLDKRSYFMELSAFAGHELYDYPLPAGGIITGVGKIHKQDIMIIANDATVVGGAYQPITIKKHLRAQEIAMANNLPCIYLVDSGGANLEMQDEVFPGPRHFGRFFRNQPRMSAAGITQISAVMGKCIAGGAYIPALCDYTTIVEKTGTIYLGGPELVLSAVGETVDEQTLGGARTHAKKSGLVDHWAKTDAEALQFVRQAVKGLNHHARSAKPPRHQKSRKPLYDPKDIYGIIPHAEDGQRKTYDVKQLIARFVDASEFSEYKSDYGKQIVCGKAFLDGRVVGIIANQGILDRDESKKAAEFVQRCSIEKTPIIFLQNTTGFMIGSRAEANGIAKDGAKLVGMISCAEVPKVTLIIGDSYGAGNYGMNGAAFDPRYIFTYPNARVGVMGAKQSSDIMMAVKGSRLQEEEREPYKEKLMDKYNTEAHPFYGAARLWDDGIIDPKDTRKVLIRAVESSLNAYIPESKFPNFRM